MTQAKTAIIAIDAMGGDIGLDTTLNAVQIAQQHNPQLHLLLVGDEAAIRAHQAFAQIDMSRCEILHSSQVVAMDELPANVLRHKNDSSMWRAIEMVRDGRAQACVSAGNTGALMASARYILKMLPNISRPAICATLPSLHGHVHCLDLGANVDVKPEQLEQFAIMGSELSKALDNNPSPKVGLLNIGEEVIKGNDTVKEAGKLLAVAPINYIGNIEGNDIFLKQGLDVVVCDGFVGNVALKSVEGIAKFIQLTLEKEYKRSFLTKIAALLSLPVLKKLKGTMDPRLYNGAMLLGLQGLVVKSHGNADAFSFANAINRAYIASINATLTHIREQLAQLPRSQEEDQTL